LLECYKLLFYLDERYKAKYIKDTIKNNKKDKNIKSFQYDCSHLLRRLNNKDPI